MMNIINYIYNSIKYLISPKPTYTMNIDMNIINSFNEKESLTQFSSKVNIFQIQYPEESQKLMNIFRYILNSKEISLRVFVLTTEILKISPWTYEVWVIRRICLSEIKELNIYNEIEFINMIILTYPKVYQVWHHRRLVIDKLNDCSQEKKIMDKILYDDSKNFHCWSHRIWMIRRFNNIEGEFEFIYRMLDNDIKNNSVWNYRFFLVEYINKNNININIIKDEIKYALIKIKICLLNESPYNYINGFINKYKRKYKEFKEELIELEALYVSNNNKKENIDDYKYIFILRILLEYYEEDKNQKKFNNIIEKLIEIDFIRKKYYLWRKNNFNLKKD